MVYDSTKKSNVFEFLPSGQLDDEIVVQQRHRVVSPKKQDKKKLLIILHGKRINDDFVRKAIEQIRAEGHEVCGAVECSCSAVLFNLVAASRWDLHQSRCPDA